MDIETKKDLMHKADLARSVERLQINADYIKLMQFINGEYQTNKVNSIARLVKQSESTNIAYEELKAISFFNAIMQSIVQDGQLASVDLNQED